MDICECAEFNYTLWNTTEILRGLSASIAIAIQKGNAAALRRWHSKTFAIAPILNSVNSKSSVSTSAAAASNSSAPTASAHAAAAVFVAGAPGRFVN